MILPRGQIHFEKFHHYFSAQQHVLSKLYSPTWLLVDIVRYLYFRHTDYIYIYILKAWKLPVESAHLLSPNNASSTLKSYIQWNIIKFIPNLHSGVRIMFFIYDYPYKIYTKFQIYTLKISVFAKHPDETSCKW